jgi:hypothetical protein
MANVGAIIGSSGRTWSGEPGATQEEIQALRAAVPFVLPEQYVELLCQCNGGEGELALPPLWFQLHSAQAVVELWNDPHYRQTYPNLFFFGGNGGLESIAFDMSVAPPWPVVAVDCIAGPESLQRIAPNIGDFIEAIGVSGE